MYGDPSGEVLGLAFSKGKEGLEDVRYIWRRAMDSGDPS